MPWCDICGQLRDELTDEGSCPACGQKLVKAEREGVPWRFKLLIAAAAIYLAWRLWQVGTWIF